MLKLHSGKIISPLADSVDQDQTAQNVKVPNLRIKKTWIGKDHEQCSLKMEIYVKVFQPLNKFTRPLTMTETIVRC